MEIFLDINIWASLATLTALEIILGIDNIVVLSVMTDRLPPEQARRARQIGLLMALGFRLALLSVISWMTKLTTPVFTLEGFAVSWRDIILIAGGLFLIFKAIQEVHAMIEGEHHQKQKGATQKAAFGAVIAQIAIMDMVFSLDSIITAVGMAQHIEVMVAAILIAMAVMYFASDIVSRFLKAHPTTKMLALCFLILIGVALVADGLHFHIPRGYIYFGMFFAAAVELFNILAKPKLPLTSQGFAAMSGGKQKSEASTLRAAAGTSRTGTPKTGQLPELPKKAPAKPQAMRQTPQAGQRQAFGAKQGKRSK